MPSTALEIIAEEFAKENNVDLLDSIKEDKVLYSDGVRYIRKAESERGVALQYSKDYVKRDERNILFIESLPDVQEGPAALKELIKSIFK